MKKYTIYVLVVLIALIINVGSTDLHAEKLLRIANVGDPGSLDPHLSSTSWENRIIGNFFMGLTTEGNYGILNPGAAEDWSVSSDGLTYVFKLRDHQWSDGIKVTAEDFEYAYKRLLAPDFPAKAASLLFLIKNAEAFKKGETKDLGVRAIDSKTLEITLTAPAPYFLSILAVPVAYPVPKHVVEKYGKDWSKPETIIVNGPYKPKEWIAKTSVQAVKNDKFYDVVNLKIDTILWYTDENWASALQHYRKGEVDIARGIPSTDLSALKTEFGKELRVAPYQGLLLYAFNVSKKPFDDKNVRRALSMAIDRENIVQTILKGGETAAYGYVPPGTLNYPSLAEADFKSLSQADREKKATEILAGAGFGKSNPLNIRLSYNASTANKAVAEAIVNTWTRLGIKASLDESALGDHYEKLRSGNFDIGRIGWVADYSDAQSFLQLFTKNGADASSRYSNPEFEKLITAAAITPDKIKRGELLKQAEALGLADMPAIPIHFSSSRNLVSSKVIGWKDNNRDVHRIRWLDLAN